MFSVTSQENSNVKKNSVRKLLITLQNNIFIRINCHIILEMQYMFS